MSTRQAPPPPPETDSPAARKKWAQALADWRAALGISKEEAASRFDVGGRTWHRWENGETLPRPALMRRVWGGASASADTGGDLGEIRQQLDRIEAQQTRLLAHLGLVPQPESRSKK